MKNLQIDTKTAQALYASASKEFKALLDKNFSKEELVGDITERVKTYVDACEELCITPVDDEELLEMGLYPHEIAGRKMAVITQALNEGTVMDWNDSNQAKWYPWFTVSSGFAFYGACYYFSTASAGCASRLCFKSEKLAEYAGRQFTDIYKAFMI